MYEDFYDFALNILKLSLNDNILFENVGDKISGDTKQYLIISNSYSDAQCGIPSCKSVDKIKYRELLEECLDLNNISIKHSDIKSFEVRCYE
jgi:hypothetical protein